MWFPIEKFDSPSEIENATCQKCGLGNRGRFRSAMSKVDGYTWRISLPPANVSYLETLTVVAVQTVVPVPVP
jgi:hypothetical protein